MVPHSLEGESHLAGAAPWVIVPDPWSSLLEPGEQAATRASCGGKKRAGAALHGQATGMRDCREGTAGVQRGERTL